MIRTVLTPQSTQLNINVPDSYIGKQVEILLYSTEELNENPSPEPPKNIARFKGFLTPEEAENYRQYLHQIRREWDRNI